MNFRFGILVLFVSAACLCATESQSNAQGFQRGGGQLAFRAARRYVGSAIPGVRAIRTVQRVGGVGFGGGGQAFRGTQRPFGLRNGLQAARLFRRF